MPIDAVVFVLVMVGIIVGVGTYKHYKKKARLLKEKLDEANGETPEAEQPASGSGSGKTTANVQHEIK